MDSLNRLPIFVQAAETKSFTKAARRLGISAAAVSKAVSHLEQTLGARLFERTTRSVTLTADGAAYYERCRQALSDLEEAEIALSQNRSTPRGKLRVSLQTALGRLYVVPALAEFAARHPDLSIEISLTDRMVEVVGEGFDVAVRLAPPSEDPRLVERQVAATRGVLCASPDYLRRCGEPESPEDLGHHNVYLYSGYPGPPFEMTLRKGGQERIAAMAGNITANNAEVLADLAVAGRGISVVLGFVAAPAVEQGTLRHVLSDWEMADGPPILVVYPGNRHLSAKVRAFVDFVSELFDAEDSRKQMSGST